MDDVGLVVVTGATGALGHAVVAEFRAAGREVVAMAHAGGRLDELGVPSALVALAGGPAPIAHATSKAAVVRMVELLADELSPQRVPVNCVLPSVIDTPANRAWMPPDLAARAVPPAAIARVVAFLAGPDSAPTSGARMPVYGPVRSAISWLSGRRMPRGRRSRRRRRPRRSPRL